MNADNKISKCVSLIPRAALLFESMRDIGYTFESAIADLIDNSISAKAKNIWIDALWNAGDKYVAISDDGMSMQRDTLISAMRLGSSDPTVKRASTDLGRFGLGLKTASLSQCRRFTVVCKSKDGVWGVAWDVDIAKQLTPPHDWDVSIIDYRKLDENKKLHSLITKRLTGTHGTLILWEKIDRPNLDTMVQTGAETVFTEQLARLSEHLSLTFHRYIVPRGNDPKCNIILNDKPIEGFDPFNEACISCKKPQGEVVKVRGEKVTITPYVLPHPIAPAINQVDSAA